MPIIKGALLLANAVEGHSVNWAKFTRNLALVSSSSAGSPAMAPARIINPARAMQSAHVRRECDLVSRASACTVWNPGFSWSTKDTGGEQNWTFACMKLLNYRVRLTLGANQANIYPFRIRGRTGFDFADTPEAACRGWFVGLVNHRTKK